MRRPIVIERPDGVIPGLWEANETLRKLGWLLMVTVDYSDKEGPVKWVRLDRRPYANGEVSQ